MRKAWAALVAAACLAPLAAASSPPAAGAQAPAPHRAAVIVDTGDQLKRVCVRFPESSISGAEALRRANVQPVFRTFPGKGEAVCALCGTGCRADESCLTCDRSGRFWAYSRAPAGSSSFHLSGSGASNTRVRDGDVEGWRWSKGQAPAYASVEQVCGGPPAATPSAGPGRGERAPPVTGGAGPSPSAATSSAPTAAAAPAPAPGAANGTSPVADGSPALSKDGAQRRAAARAPRPRTRTSGSVAGMALFAAVVGLLAGAALWARRRDRGRA